MNLFGVCDYPPFKGCKTTLYYNKGKKKEFVRIRGIIGDSFADKTMLPSRFYMSIKLGKILDPDQYTSIIDDTKECGIDNVEMLSPEEFRKKQKLKKQKKYEKKCVICEKPFWIPKSRRETCSAECFSKLLSLIKIYRNSSKY